MKPPPYPKQQETAIYLLPISHSSRQNGVSWALMLEPESKALNPKRLRPVNNLTKILSYRRDYYVQ